MDTRLLACLLVLLPVAVLASVLAYNLYLQNRALAARNHLLKTALATAATTGDAQAVTMFRTLRHTVMNDLQIVLGWLQLGNLQRATEQSEIVRERLVREGQLMTVKPAGLIHGILSRSAWAEANGIRVTYVVADDLSGCQQADERFATAFSEALGGLFEALLGAGAHGCTMTVGRARDVAEIDVQCDVALAPDQLPASIGGVTIAPREPADGAQGTLVCFTVATNTDGD